MRRLIIYFVGLLFIWVFLSQCFILRSRWSDKKSIKIFSSKHVPLFIHDTVINSQHLHFAISGSDTLPTLVFIHGSPGSWMDYSKYMWDPSLLKKYRMISIDRPGFGYSDFGKASHLQEQTAIISKVLVSQKNDLPMFLFGHSLGGAVVAELAALDPDMYKGIVIAAGALDVSLEKKEKWRRIMSVKPLYWFLPGAYGPSNTELLYLKKDLVQLQDEFKNITCEVHFIHGSKDTWVPIGNMAYGMKMMTNARVVTADTIIGADHNIPWKNIDEIKKVLLKLY
jgi:pimeloyl-ACP methyl ester carboxylesterase